jgi:hypothetical protein
MPELSQDVPKETPTLVEAKVPEVTLPPAHEPEKDTPKAVTPRMRLIIAMETPPIKERHVPEPQRIVELVRHDGCERVYRILTRRV